MLGVGWLGVDYSLLDTLWLSNHAWELLGNTLDGIGPDWAITGPLQELNSRNDPSFLDSGLFPGTV